MQFEELSAGEALKQAMDSVGRSDRVVVCGSPDEVGLLEEFAEDVEQSPQEILEAARRIDVAEWFRKREAEIGEDRADVLDEDEWPGWIDTGGLTLTDDVLTGEPLPSVAVARLQVRAPWEIPAHFRYGGWNDCPEPEVHCAVWKDWHERYGAHIVGVSGSIIEAVVERPPMEPEEAMRLAWQQYLYCTDIVDQGAESVANLAGGLFLGRTWYFWWD
jgi:hypothetical protein